MPQVYLPLEALESCHACGSAVNLRLCAQCAERAYCSTECQKQDWKAHKTTCKTDRIDLSTFYPVLACIIEESRMRTGAEHPALLHQIKNAPNPNTPAYDLPGGGCARLVGLGPSLLHRDWLPDFSGWWPKGATPLVRGKLMRRILREGNAIPLVVSTCLSLLLSLYSTTTSEGSTDGPHRLRLRYRSSPVSDFGIANGSARVTPQDQLAYLLPDLTLLRGQDPEDHYWIYFRTIKGEEVVLDCNMFTFNMCLGVQPHPYVTPISNPRFADIIPAWFRDRTMARRLPSSDPLLTERRRISVLRDNALRAAVEEIDINADGDFFISPESADAISAFMAKVSDKPLKQRDKQQEICIASMIHGTNVILDATVRSDAWKKYPKEPPTAIEADPGELDD